MKTSYALIASILGMAVFFPIAAFSEDQKKTDGKSSGAQQHGGGGKPAQHAAPHAPSPQSHAANVQHQGGRTTAPSQQVSHSANVQQSGSQRSTSGGSVAHSQQKHSQVASSQVTPNGAVSSQQRSYSAGTASHGQQKRGQGASHQIISNNGSVKSYSPSGVSPSTPQVAQSRSGRGGGYAGQVTPNSQYNSGNNYGGNWYPANTHNDWNQNGQYYWNNHNYRWYQGGWLIIDLGFNPYYVNTGYSGYSNNGSTVSSVQASLADQGYYNGPIDGMMGRGTRSAIANYQSDHNLRVTGHINDDLLQSLQPQ